MKKYIKKVLKRPIYLRLKVLAVFFLLLGTIVLGNGIINNKTLSVNTEPVTSNGTPSISEDQILVKVSDEVAGTPQEQGVRAIVEQYSPTTNVEKEIEGGSVDTYSVQIADPGEVNQTLEELKSDSSVESVQWNYKYTPDATPNDPDYNLQWSYPITQSPEGWDITTGSPSAVIAVVGTGVRWIHADLSANTWANPGESSNGLDDDGNGLIDDVRGWDYENNDNNPLDQNGHDTGVAGIIAATGNNSIGISGICWSCKIMALRVDFSSAQVANAINYASAKGARVIMMSFGTYDIAQYGPDTIVEAAINNAYANGVLLVSTAGNDNVDTQRYPGALPNVIGVAATDQTDARASFSNFGSWVDIAAPGDNIHTTTLSSYGAQSGTSYAGAFVAGVAGLLYSNEPGISVGDARNRILAGVDTITQDQPIGSGRINTLKVLTTVATPTPTPTDTPTPTPTLSPTPTPDTSPPSANILTPPTNFRVAKGTVNINVTATDPSGIDRIEYYIDNVLATTSSSTTFAWNTAPLVTNSNHSVYIKAYDTQNNMGQSSTSSYIIIVDSDRDGYSDIVENYVGTNPNLACGVNAWPSDFNNDNWTNLSDITMFAPSFNKKLGNAGYNARFDLNADGWVNLSDVVNLGIVFNKNCSTGYPFY